MGNTNSSEAEEEPQPSTSSHQNSDVVWRKEFLSSMGTTNSYEAEEEPQPSTSSHQNSDVVWRKEFLSSMGTTNSYEAEEEPQPSTSSHQNSDVVWRKEFLCNMGTTNSYEAEEEPQPSTSSHPNSDVVWRKEFLCSMGTTNSYEAEEEPQPSTSSHQNSDVVWRKEFLCSMGTTNSYEAEEEPQPSTSSHQNSDGPVPVTCTNIKDASDHEEPAPVTFTNIKDALDYMGLVPVVCTNIKDALDHEEPATEAATPNTKEHSMDIWTSLLSKATDELSNLLDPLLGDGYASTIEQTPQQPLNEPLLGDGDGDASTIEQTPQQPLNEPLLGDGDASTIEQAPQQPLNEPLLGDGDASTIEQAPQQPLNEPLLGDGDASTIEQAPQQPLNEPLLGDGDGDASTIEQAPQQPLNEPLLGDGDGDASTIEQAPQQPLNEPLLGDGDASTIEQAPQQPLNEPLVWDDSDIEIYWKYIEEKEFEINPVQLRSHQLEYRDAIVQDLRTMSQILGLYNGTLHLAVYYLDCVMDNYFLEEDEFKEVAVACLSVAAKHEEKYTLALSFASLSALSGISLRGAQFRVLEWQVSSCVDWKLYSPTAVSFAWPLARFVVTDEDMGTQPPDVVTRLKSDGALFLDHYLDVILSDVRLCHTDRVILGCASVACARISLELQPWTPILAKTSRREYSVVEPIVQRLIMLMSERVAKMIVEQEIQVVNTFPTETKEETPCTPSPPKYVLSPSSQTGCYTTPETEVLTSEGTPPKSNIQYGPLPKFPSTYRDATDSTISESGSPNETLGNEHKPNSLVVSERPDNQDKSHNFGSSLTTSIPNDISVSDMALDDAIAAQALCDLKNSHNINSASQSSDNGHPGPSSPICNCLNQKSPKIGNCRLEVASPVLDKAIADLFPASSENTPNPTNNPLEFHSSIIDQALSKLLDAPSEMAGTQKPVPSVQVDLSNCSCNGNPTGCQVDLNLCSCRCSLDLNKPSPITAFRRSQRISTRRSSIAAVYDHRQYKSMQVKKRRLSVEPTERSRRPRKKRTCY